jgi:hypothetical protein
MLSSSNRAVAETSLKRMVANAYGTLATIPLYWVGQLSAPDADAIVTARHDVWHSYLGVAREMLRSTLLESARAPLDSLFDAADGLRDAFLKLLHTRTMRPAAVRANYRRLVDAYEQIAQSVEEIGGLSDLTASLVPGPTSITRVCFERSLRWFGQELEKVAGTLNCSQRLTSGGN